MEKEYKRGYYKSEKRSQTSRLNGKLGGRPKTKKHLYVGKERECTICKQVLPILDFGPLKKKGVYQIAPRCRNCDNARYRDKEKKAIRAREYAKKSRIMYPEKWRARAKVADAVRRGLLIRLPCQFCGEEKVEGHHPDYSKPLEVIWVCGKHHKEIHRIPFVLINDVRYQFNTITQDNK